MAGYSDTREKILETLMQRAVGTEIQPENHQDFALNLLEYVRNVELISASTLIGVAEEDTVPVQSNDANEAYIAAVLGDMTKTFKNFRNSSGNPISVSGDEHVAKIAILLWNRQYWSACEIPTNVICSANTASLFYYYSMIIRKTYGSVASMNADVTRPIGDDNRTIGTGGIVAVHNSSNTSENAIYCYRNTYWQKIAELSALDTRTLDAGRADTVYGGTMSVNCGTAAG